MVDRPQWAQLDVTIVRFVDGCQPGIFACEFLDAKGWGHTLVDKVPIFSVEDLDAESEYPRPFAVRFWKRGAPRKYESSFVLALIDQTP